MWARAVRGWLYLLRGTLEGEGLELITIQRAIGPPHHNKGRRACKELSTAPDHNPDGEG
jgi:hypothetical protein